MARKGNLQRAINDGIRVSEAQCAEGISLDFSFGLTKECREEFVRAFVYRHRSKKRLAHRNWRQNNGIERSI